MATLVTYFVAPWDALTPGAVPTRSVQEVTCGWDGGCETREIGWGTNGVQIGTRTTDVEAAVTGVRPSVGE